MLIIWQLLVHNSCVLCSFMSCCCLVRAVCVCVDLSNCVTLHLYQNSRLSKHRRRVVVNGVIWRLLTLTALDNSAWCSSSSCCHQSMHYSRWSAKCSVRWVQSSCHTAVRFKHLLPSALAHTPPAGPRLPVIVIASGLFCWRPALMFTVTGKCLRVSYSLSLSLDDHFTDCVRLVTSNVMCLWGQSSINRAIRYRPASDYWHCRYQPVILVYQRIASDLLVCWWNWKLLLDEKQNNSLWRLWALCESLSLVSLQPVFIGCVCIYWAWNHESSWSVVWSADIAEWQRVVSQSAADTCHRAVSVTNANLTREQPTPVLLSTTLININRFFTRVLLNSLCLSKLQLHLKRVAIIPCETVIFTIAASRLQFELAVSGLISYCIGWTWPQPESRSLRPTVGTR